MIMSGIKIFQIDSDEKNSGHHIDMVDELNHAEIESVVHLNYLLDIEWYTGQFPRYSVTFVVHHANQIKGELFHVPQHIKFIQPPLAIPYGTHHTKAIFFFYKDKTMKIIIHTANLIHSDFSYKTQGAWSSPILKRKTTAHDQICDFEKDLIEYLNSYGPLLNELVNEIKSFDYLPCNDVFLIPSVPGRHSSTDFGFLKLEKTLKSSYTLKDECNEIILQCSSVGSLGSTRTWLDRFYKALSASTTEADSESDHGNYLKQQKKKTKISQNAHKSPSSLLNYYFIYPTITNVQNSIEGWLAGNSLPYSNKNYIAQKHYLLPYLCSWKSKTRERYMPHIKTYVRMNFKGDIGWYLITSANLSKAAWVEIQKNGLLFVRSYELGVLVIGDLLERKLRMTSDDKTDSTQVILPYDIPPSKYTSQDECWRWDISIDQPDMRGEYRIV